MPSILITGGTGKFGRVLVNYFLAAGWKVLFTGRSEESVQALQLELGGPDNLIGYAVDFTDREVARLLVDRIMAGSGPVDYLVNNARSLSTLRVGGDGCTAREDFMNELLIDVVVPYELSIALTRVAGGQLKGIVNIGSIYGLVAPNLRLYENPWRDSPIQYGVAKAALVHLTKELAVRLADDGVRVNCVAYGGVEGRANEAFKARYGELAPSRRMLTEQEIPGPVAFLCSDQSGGTTGHTIVVDGGWTSW